MKRVAVLAVLLGALSMAVVLAQPTAGAHDAVRGRQRRRAHRHQLLSGKDRIDLRYFGAGHTNGDVVIVFPALRTAVMGDLFARKWAPYADATNGGSMTAFPRTLADAIGAIRDVDTVITGHATTTIGSGANVSFVRSNPVMKWADLQESSPSSRGSS